MAITFTGQATGQFSFVANETFTALGDTGNQTPLAQTLAFASGTGAGSMDKVYAAQRSLAANTSETLNLAANTLLDVLNLPIIMARVKAVFIHLVSTTDDSSAGTNCNAITMAGLNGSAGFIDGTTPKLRVFNGGFKSFGVNNAAGVTSGLALNVTNEDPTNAATYRIVVYGASA